MNKLKLQIDNLQVETFDTAEAGEGRRGTVLAASGIQSRQFTECEPNCEFETRATGSCCDISLVISCALTNCAECVGP